MVTDGGFLLLEKREVEHDDTFFMSEVELEQKEVEHDYADQSQYCGIKRILLKWTAFVLSFSFQILKIKEHITSLKALHRSLHIALIFILTISDAPRHKSKNNKILLIRSMSSCNPLFVMSCYKEINFIWCCIEKRESTSNHEQSN
jgi:hypothetical protein